MALSLLFPEKRARRDFARIVKESYNQKMIMFDSSEDSLCDSFARGVKDCFDYAERNFGRDGTLKKDLETAYQLCSSCKRDPENDNYNCDEVFRKLKATIDHLEKPISFSFFKS